MAVLWQIPELPPEEVDSSTPAMLPLMIAVAPCGPVALTVAARPAYGDGGVSAWTQYLVTSDRIEPAAMGRRAAGPFDGFVGGGRMEQDGTAMESRFAFFEDGGRLVQVGLIVPAALFGSVETVWEKALDSFGLEPPRGQRTPVSAAAVPYPGEPRRDWRNSRCQRTPV
jgi:hypothetical protein